ncbi:glycosyltransferase family 4 protein [Saxibacter everestensis]|uniref:Glycosyltransferase family 4 protein n=1 Tax=Saxibacter everestensis TaxID=2909229 RepID=A0ABY8QYE5_9MICO|nr:glycosyltransferase family 4 protein [Brevibacteriaceae bacterium ZFBP1038]
MRQSERIGYVLKMYPRFSETFIVSEMLAREAAGEELEIFSLRPPVDPRFHAALAEVRAPVTYLDRPNKAETFFQLVRDCTAAVPGFTDMLAAHLDELFAASADNAFQAICLARHVLERGITHLHAHFASVATSVTRLAAMIAGVPFSFTAHAKDLFHESVDEIELRTKLRAADHVVTISDFNLSYLLTRFGADAAKVRRVYNGLLLERFPYREPAELHEPIRIVAIGRLVEKKGFADLVRAVKKLSGAGVGVEAVIAGGGPLEDELRQQIASAGLSGRITLLGAQPQHRVAELLGTADVFVAPCVHGSDGNADGLPTVLLEAMASGVPCVATGVTGIPEVIRDGETGILIQPGDAAALADAIGRIASGEADRCLLTKNARALIEQEFDSRHQARQLARLLVGAEVPTCA